MHQQRYLVLNDVNLRINKVKKVDFKDFEMFLHGFKMSRGVCECLVVCTNVFK